MTRVKKKGKQKQQPPQAPPEPVRRGNAVVAAALAIGIVILATLGIAAYVRNSIYRTKVTLWENIVKRSPDKRRAHENYGQALSSAGFYNEALEQFKTVMSLPDDQSVPPRDLYREIGVVYFRLGLYSEAIASWQTGLRYAPGDATLLNNLSIGYMQEQRFDEAAAAAQAALMSSPNMPQALNTMGQVYMMKKQYAKAVKYFLRALNQEPDVPARYWNVALALQQTKQYDQAYRYASKYIAMEPNPQARQIAINYLKELKTLIRH